VTTGTSSAPELPLPGQGSGTGWFVYGVAAGTIAVPDRLRGIDGQPPQLLRDGDLAALASTTLLGRSPDRPEDRRAYTDVLDAIARRQVVVPLPFGTVYADEDEVRDRLLAPSAARLAARLAHLAGRVELRLVASARDGALAAPEHASGMARELLDTLRPACVEMVTLPATGPATVLEAALLIERGRVAGLHDVVDTLGGTGDGPVVLTLEGPMAAYDFTDGVRP
jgi:hypothetical protein